MFKRFLPGLALALFLAGFLAGPARAESPIPAVSPFAQRYEQFAEAREGGGLAETPQQQDENDEFPYRAAPPRPKDESPAPHAARPDKIAVAAPVKNFSPLETMYSGRAGRALTQFGYDLFGVPAPETQKNLDRLAGKQPAMPMGAVQDDFILHAGDELEITFAGQRTDHGIYTVNSQGLLVIPDMPPVPAEGRAIGQVRLSIEAAARNLHNTNAYVSLASVRQINVLVMGHVRRPGRQTLTVFHTVIDALMESGGIDKTGSLRQIKLVRGGTNTTVDLYSVLMQGGAETDLRLRDGDRLIVPSIGPTVAVAGEVKRPGVYELLPRQERLTLAALLELGGGVLAPGRNRFMALEVTRGGHEKGSEISDASLPVFGDGAMLLVEKGQEKRAGTVEMAGHTRRPGLYALDETHALGRLLNSSDVLGPDAYPLIGVIERQDHDSLARQLIAFPLRLVLKGTYEATLQDGDKIHIFSDAYIRRLARPVFAKTESAAEPAAPNRGETNRDEAMDAFLREHSAFVRGAVRNPGAYPVGEGITLDLLLAAAGGPSVEADTGDIEVASGNVRDSTPRRRKISAAEAESVVVGAGDAVRVGQKFQRAGNKSVLIIGEVKNPGRYDLLPGDKVSSLIARAGGITGDAYPDGAVFSREKERRAEEARFRAQAREMQAAIAAALEQDKGKIGAGQIAEARALAATLERAEGIGRLTIEADPYALGREPELDMLLEPGDRLYIPKRALTVRVSGETLSPANLQFRKNKKAGDYVKEAGGYTRNADKKRTFVLYPDGSAQPVDVGWNDGDIFIPPGSTIVVPRDPEPFDFIQSAKDVSQILSNLAITALFIDDVRDDD